jgi:hypothetical protein
VQHWRDMPALLLLLAFALVSCNTAAPMTSAAAAPTVPRIEITTDGGFAGRGLGSIVIDGTSIAAKDLSRTCHGELTAQEEETLARAAAAFKPSDHSAPAHPDQIGYTLKAGEQSMSWYGEEAPPEAAPLFGVAWNVRHRVLDGCK